MQAGLVADDAVTLAKQFAMMSAGVGSVIAFGYLDVVIIDRRAEAREEARTNHRTDGPGVGLFRLQVEVAAGRDVGLASSRVVDDPDPARRSALREADRCQVGIRPTGSPSAQDRCARLVRTVVCGVNNSAMFGARTAWL